MKKAVSFALVALALVGCGMTPSTSPVLNKTAQSTALKSKAADLNFESVSIKDVAAKKYSEGKLVSFEGSFGESKNRYWRGYQLWDRAGNGVSVYNIYTACEYPNGMKGYGVFNTAKDLNASAARELLQYGKYVKIEGEVKAGACIDIYFINGIPVSQYVSKSGKTTSFDPPTPWFYLVGVGAH